MTNTKSTKRALLASVMALLLCFSMLLSTTFAWFTDSVTSGNNIIKSGNLDIELEYWNGTAWADVKDASDILTNTLWEPGVTKVAYLRIANAGSLVLKYQFGINILNEIDGKNQKNETFKLSDYIMFGVVEGVNGETGAYAKTDAGRAEAVAAVTDEKKISAGYTKASTMEPDEELYLALVVYMPTDTDNVANHNGTDIPQIDLGINVLATQMTAENDSFDNQYDKDATYYDALATTTEELETALVAGKKIIGIKGTAVELAAESAGKNRDMNGVTIVGASDDATLTVTGTGGGLDNINLKNIKVVDSTFYTSENGENAWEFTYLELGGINTFVNVAFDDGIMSDGPMSTFVDCTFSGHNNDSSAHGTTTMYGAWVYSGKATFTDCYFSGTRGLKVCDQYAGEVSNVVVDACVFGPLSEKPGLAIDDREESSFNIVIKNSYFIDCQAGDQNEYIYETDNYVPVLENNTIVANGTVVATAEALNAVTNGENVFLATDIDIVNTDANNQMFIEATGELNFNGIGNTISVSGSNPSEGNHNYVSFLPPAGTSAKVENVTVTGEGFVEVGDYFQGGGSYTVNNVTVKDLVSTLANGDKGLTLACGFAHYGNATLNDCVMTGTTNMIDGAMPVDLGCVNGTTTVINRGEYGTIYCWSNAVVTIDGAEVDTLYVSPIKGSVTVKAGTAIEKLVVDYGTSAGNVTQARLQKLVIEEGATVNEIVYAGNSYTVETWNAFVAAFGA